MLSAQADQLCQSTFSVQYKLRFSFVLLNRNTAEVQNICSSLDAMMFDLFQKIDSLVDVLCSQKYAQGKIALTDIMQANTCKCISSTIILFHINRQNVTHVPITSPSKSKYVYSDKRENEADILCSIEGFANYL